jgi:magnesium-transporting ATPase (P-type)
MFMFCIALAVSAIPEGLPVAMTVALAVATTRMAKRGVIVRRLTAVEGLGSCTLIATDKTGTLTCNELTIQRVILPNDIELVVTGQGFVPEGEVYWNDRVLEPGSPKELGDLIRAGILCNEADLHKAQEGWISRGDAVDLALLVLGHKLGWSHHHEVEIYPQVNQIPFEAELQFAATFHRDGEGTAVFVKGAPERILRMCDSTTPEEERKRLENLALKLAAEGFRVLALADGRLPMMLNGDEVPPALSDLRFLGFVGMLDPLRPGVKEAVAECREAGIDVAMVTGDHRVTALAIARELDLAAHDDQVLTGDQLAALEKSAWPDVIRRTRIFARVAPHQKLEIVKAAQAAGHFVSVTGDGVNDAPALQAANIGVAMGGNGTDVAREAAELVIRDDNFTTIVAGIEEGRVAYDNIRKVIFLLVSTGAAEVALVLFTILAGLPLPLIAAQLLWLNLVTNGIQGVALAFEPNEGDVLQRSPRPPSQPVFDRLMLERLLVSVAVMGCVGFATFHYLTVRLGWDTDRARNSLLLLMVLFENIHIGNCRSETKSAFALSPFRSPFLLIGAMSAFLLHMIAMYVPWGHAILGTSPVSLVEGLAIFGLALTILPAIELHKWHWNKRNTRKLRASRSIA